MSYKNSIKLLSSNFNIVWKQLLYMLVVCIVLFGIGYGFAIPTINLLKSNDVISEIKGIFETIYTAPKDVVNAVSDTFLHLTNVITKNFSKIWLSLLSTTVIIQVLYQLLKNISFYNISSLMHYQMTSFVQVGYSRNLVSTLAQSVRFAFSKLIFSIPFSFLKLAIVYTYFKLASTPIGIFIGLFIVSLALILLSAIELTIFTGHIGHMLEQGGNVSAFKAFFKGTKTVLKKFFRVYSNAIIVVLTIIMINLFLGIFTLGAGLLITLPATMLFIAIFELCAYFGVKGERYYLSSTIIATPLKDAENENVNNIK